MDAGGRDGLPDICAKGLGAGVSVSIVWAESPIQLACLPNLPIILGFAILKGRVSGVLSQNPSFRVKSDYRPGMVVNLSTCFIDGSDLVAPLLIWRACRAVSFVWCFCALILRVGEQAKYP